MEVDIELPSQQLEGPETLQVGSRAEKVEEEKEEPPGEQNNEVQEGSEEAEPQELESEEQD